MKRKLLFLFLMTATCTQLWAQRTVSGKVTSAEDGSSLPGVNVVVVGSQQGSITDVDGNYTLQVPDQAVLKFSYIGFADFEVEVGNQSVIDVVLQTDVTRLSEVVVTALGVERDVQALNYSVTEVGGDNLTEAREINLGNALTGRIAGVNVTSPSSGPAGSTRILIRGNKSLNGQNQPLYVVDGIPMDNTNYGQAGLWGGRDEGDGLTSISPDDIESITVLKGANASALYGSRGGNGVVNIVTKQGKKRKGVGIEFNSNYTFDVLYDQSELQTKYGAGNYRNEISSKPETLQQAFDDGRSSWGPALDGSPVLQWDGVARPYSYTGNKFENFFETGNTFTNTLALSGGGDQQTYRFSVTDLRSTSILPNSGFDRTNVTLSTNGKYFDKLSLNAKVMYSNEKAKNRPRLSDSPSNAVQSIWYTPNNVDVQDQRGPEDRLGAIPEGLDPQMYTIYGQGGDPRTPGMEWLPAANNWGQNPWWATHTEINDDTRDRLIGSAGLRYDILDWLYVSGRVGMDWASRKETSLTPQGTGYNLGGNMTEANITTREINMEWILGMDKTWGEIGLNAFVGGNKMERSWERIAAQGNGFNVAFFEAINNAAVRNYGYGFDQSGINSLFGSVELNWKNLVYLTATGRNDWFSVLNPESGNDIFYPSVGGTWIFSDTFESTSSWLSFGKLRASWAQVGLVTIGPYATNLEYALRGETHLGRPMAGISNAFGRTAILPNTLLRPALSTEIEMGFDVRFFQDRLGIDFAYYDQQTTDDIVSQTISVGSGFGATRVNVGKITNKGWELLLSGTPIQSELVWDVSLNLSHNVNEVVSLVDGLTELVGEEPRTRNAFIKHIVGEPYGTITGRVQATDPNGNLVYDADGRAVAENEFVPIGLGVPPWSWGVNNTFSFKNFRLDVLIDGKNGSEIFSGTNLRLTQGGWTEQSVQGREGEAPLRITGVTNTGSTEAPVWTPVDRDLTPQEARDYWQRLGDQSNGISSAWIYDGSFAKLRSVVFGYSFPRSMLTKTPFQNLSLSFVGRNLLVISKHIDNVDPESSYSSNGGAQGLEYFAMPATRSYGFNLRIGF
jgi:TonB-linked SusC/RagA family outer membrane protein